jgi:hypothetical protein
MPGADDDENPRPLAMEGRPIYKKIDKYERAGDQNCLEPAWKEHWEERGAPSGHYYRAGSCVTLRCFARRNYGV